MEANVREQLMGIQNQISGLLNDPRLQKVSIRQLGGPIHPAGGLCLLRDDIHNQRDFLDALNKIHQWIGYIIEVMELNH